MSATVGAHWLELTSLAPLGERVARNRRFHQPGWAGRGRQNPGAGYELDPERSFWDIPEVTFGTDPLPPMTSRTWGPLRLAVPHSPKGARAEKILIMVRGDEP